MMRLWFEEYTKRAPVTPSAVLSVVTHFVLIGAAVVATASTDLSTGAMEETVIARFLAPPDRAQGQAPQREMIRYVAIAVPMEDPIAPIADLAEVKPIEELASGTDERDALRVPELPGVDSVFSVIDVDTAASRYEWSAAPVFPPKMLEQQINGFVRAEWVVMADGYADTASLTIVESTHEEFSKAVRDALPFMRFSPAKIGRKTVSQLVQQEFTFRITVSQPNADSVTARKPGR